VEDLDMPNIDLYGGSQKWKFQATGYFRREFNKSVYEKL
jgi:hypothetical protein